MALVQGICCLDTAQTFCTQWNFNNLAFALPFNVKAVESIQCLRAFWSNLIYPKTENTRREKEWEESKTQMSLNSPKILFISSTQKQKGILLNVRRLPVIRSHIFPYLLPASEFPSCFQVCAGCQAGRGGALLSALLKMGAQTTTSRGLSHYWHSWAYPSRSKCTLKPRQESLPITSIPGVASQTAQPDRSSGWMKRNNWRVLF